MYILQLSQFVLIAHKLCHFEKNVVLNMLTDECQLVLNQTP
jgi:hypothetical protein